jgi:hypothetical protein
MIGFAGVRRARLGGVGVVGIGACFVLTGCFSMGVWSGGGRHPSLREAAAAGAADLVTLPVQVPLVAIGNANAKKLEAVRNRYFELRPALMVDPEVLLERGYHLTPQGETTIEWRVVEMALLDTQIHFSDRQLRRLYREMTLRRELAVGKSGASPEFIREVWEERKKSRDHETFVVLKAIVFGTSTPDDVLEAIAATGRRYGEISGLAHTRLVDRAREAATEAR